MATRPATAPLMAPKAVGLSRCSHSTAIQASAAAIVDNWMATKALVTTAIDADAAAPVNPNQPTHMNAAPQKENGKWFGIMSMRPYPCRGPMVIAITSALTPALMWITAPPAKSRLPRFASHPFPPHNDCANGTYTVATQQSPKTRKNEKWIRSTMPPATKARATDAIMPRYNERSASS